MPSDLDPRELDPEARRDLRSLPKDLADRVAGHLIMAGRLIDEEPEQAHAHARVARRLAGRVGIVREAVGLTAYHAGEYAEALAELRAARRITGRADHLAVMADCERGLGRPERALALAQEPVARELDQGTKIELMMVVSGARRDMGQPEAAVVALQGRELDASTLQPWTPRLWYAYADALLDAGRTEEAREWFAAVLGVDEDGETDAEERLRALGG